MKSPYPLYSAETLDDAMKIVFEDILTRGHKIKPTRGEATELIGVILNISNPKARLSRTETRGRTFSCLGELLWYLAASDDLEFISYYIPKYKHYTDIGKASGAYGPRLFDWKGLNQVKNVVDLLRRNPYSRQAVIQLFDANDLSQKQNDVPCTCTVQFFVREGKLVMFTSMRSNDAFLGLPHDVFSFTMIQEIVANSLSVELGEYKHVVGSIHIYEQDIQAAQAFVNEGWQSTIPMPNMPKGDPWPSVSKLLEAEELIRKGNNIKWEDFNKLDPYWVDLIKLLQIFRCKRENNANQIRKLKAQIISKTYSTFIDKVLDQLARQS